MGPYPFLVVTDPVIVKDILTSRYCINKGIIYDALDDGTGKGLFSLKGKKKIKTKWFQLKTKSKNVFLQIPSGVFIENI